MVKKSSEGRNFFGPINRSNGEKVRVGEKVIKNTVAGYDFLRFVLVHHDCIALYTEMTVSNGYRKIQA